MKTAIQWALVVPQMLIRGFMFSLMWGWFVVPTFLLPKLSLVVAVGLCEMADLLLMGLFVLVLWPKVETKLRKEHPGKLDDDDTSLILKQVVTIFVLYPIALGIAFVVSRFMP